MFLKAGAWKQRFGFFMCLALQTRTLWTFENVGFANEFKVYNKDGIAFHFFKNPCTFCCGTSVGITYKGGNQNHTIQQAPF
jgi:hypothetical protein